MPRSKTAVIVPPKTTALQVVEPRPSFVQTIKEGFAFGAGSSIARNAIDRIMGQSLPPSRVSHEPCIIEQRAFENCILTHDSEIFCGDRQIALSDCMKNTKM